MDQLSEYDLIEVINDRAEYTKHGVKMGDQGIILGGERNGYVLVGFEGKVPDDPYADITVGFRIEDLKKIDQYT